MKTWIDICPYCKKEFVNRSGHRQHPRKSCSLECARKEYYRRRIAEGYFKRKNGTPEMKAYKTMWARNHPEVGRIYRLKNKEKIAERNRLRGRTSGDYPEEFFLIKYQIKARDKNKCTKCGESDRLKLIVHHKDKNRYNNDMENLVTLCRICHGIAHRDNLIEHRYLLGRSAL